MIELATSSDGGRRYVVFEHSREVQNLSLRGLGYFKQALGMSDYLGSFGSWIERRGPVLIACLSEAQLLAWCMFEPWERSDRDRTPIFLLRTIEVGARRRGQAPPAPPRPYPLSRMSRAFWRFQSRSLTAARLS